jgi:hypothetical protein
MENLTAVIDQKQLQEKVNEYALKGAIETIKDYYTGYNSPYRKAIAEELAKGEIKGIALPDMLAIVNDSLSAEIQAIAHTAIAQTFIPQVKKFFTKAEGEMKFSEFLKEFIEITEPEEIDDVSVSVEKHERYDWLTVNLTAPDKSYSLTLHEDWDTKKEQGLKKKYQFLSMPYNSGRTGQMKIKIDEATIEVPFSQANLQDNVISFIASLVIARTKFTMDTQEFSDDMFPEKCHCH